MLFFHYALAFWQVPYSFTQAGRQEFRLVWDYSGNRHSMGMREHFCLISAVHTFSCGFVRHFICINSCLLTSLLQQQIVPCKKAAIRDPSLIFQSTPSTSLCSWLFKIKIKIKTKLRKGITLFANSIITCIARMKYQD